MCRVGESVCCCFLFTQIHYSYIHCHILFLSEWWIIKANEASHKSKHTYFHFPSPVADAIFACSAYNQQRLLSTHNFNTLSSCCWWWQNREAFLKLMNLRGETEWTRNKTWLSFVNIMHPFCKHLLLDVLKGSFQSSKCYLFWNVIS